MGSDRFAVKRNGAPLVSAGLGCWNPALRGLNKPAFLQGGFRENQFPSAWRVK